MVYLTLLNHMLLNWDIFYTIGKHVRCTFGNFSSGITDICDIENTNCNLCNCCNYTVEINYSDGLICKPETITY